METRRRIDQAGCKSKNGLEVSENPYSGVPQRASMEQLSGKTLLMKKRAIQKCPEHV
jgi:hypothetical protein